MVYYNNNKNRNNNSTRQQSRGGANQVELKAPFNFVPLPNYKNAPFLPDWNDQVSQDYPFKDGISGKIMLDISAKTDIYVHDSNDDSLFNNIDGRYFIPGSSIKGSLRSTLEIVTFGKLAQYNDSSFHVRDLGNNTYKQTIKDIKAGWLYIHNDKYYIYVCSDDPINVVSDRITAEEIDREIGRNTFYNFIHGMNGNNFKNDENRNAKKKYQLLYNESDKQIEQRTNFFYKIKNGKHAGKYLVMTGQPGIRNDSKHSGKYKEFVFPCIPPIDSNGIVFDENVGWQDLTQNEVDAFKSINKDSANYVDFWEKVLKHGGAIPVFYKELEEEDEKEMIFYVGLTYMLKYPAKNSITDAIQPQFRQKKHDMAELIFGYSDKDSSLKGRVHVGHAFADNVVLDNQDRNYALSSPKPSYSPLYLQNGKTWDSKGDINILGRKRYPTRDEVYSQNVDGISLDMIKKIRPLKAGSSFKSEITFHNLKPEELGALLYTITTLDFHQLGGLKPYGYGKVSIVPTLNIKGISNPVDYTEFVDTFVNLFNKEFGNDWQNCNTIKELRAMAHGIKPGKEHKFKYMQMSIGKDNKNEFNDGRNCGKSLRPFSEINE
jgi:CRISPR-associated protein (TIGR03986 family)